jgi:hypothetical protein
VIAEIQSILLEKIATQKDVDILMEENSWLIKQLSLKEHQFKK